MYDKSKQEFVPVEPDKIRAKLEKMARRTDGSPASSLSSDVRVSEVEVMKQAGIAAGISPEDQGPVFVKGEVFTLRGIQFVVRGVGNKEITFRIAPNQKKQLNP